MDKLTYTPYRAFDWVVLKVECPLGHSFLAEVTKSGPRADSANFTLHSAGILNAKCLTDDLPIIPQRLPGMSSLDLNPLRAGNFEFTAEQAARWWCINWDRNGKRLPNVTPVVMAAGMSRTFPVGSRLFLGDGAVTVNGVAIELPSSIKASTQDVEVTCSADTYGFLFL
jgi:hypothetical protein